MVITPKQVKNLTYLVVDDLYEPGELLQIKAELNKLLPYVQNPEQTCNAKDEKGNLNKTGTGIFLDEHYNDRAESAILNLNRKLFCEEIVVKGTELNQFFYAIRMCNSDNTLINYYKSGGEYKQHRDSSVITAVTFFALGEISGGDLEFPEIETVVSFKENRAVIFPGCVLHAAKPVITQENGYRVSMAQILNYRD
jgi:hypothetical protein